MFAQQSYLSNRTTHVGSRATFCHFCILCLNSSKYYPMFDSEGLNDRRGRVPSVCTYWHCFESDKGGITQGHWEEFLASFQENPRFIHKSSKGLKWQLNIIGRERIAQQIFANWLRDSALYRPYFLSMSWTTDLPLNENFSLPFIVLLKIYPLVNHILGFFSELCSQMTSLLDFFFI